MFDRTAALGPIRNRFLGTKFIFPVIGFDNADFVKASYIVSNGMFSRIGVVGTRKLRC